MCISIKSITDGTLMPRPMVRVSYLVNENIRRSSSNLGLQNGRHDSEAHYFLTKLQAVHKDKMSHKTVTGNVISSLQNQESALCIAAKAVDRITILKTLHSNPFKSDTDRENDDKEFKELAEQLVFLKQSKFNNVSLFSVTESGFGLNLYGTQSVYDDVDSSSIISISQNVIDFEDIKRFTETFVTTNRGFGGLEVVNFLESASLEQFETLSSGAGVAEGDVLSVSIRKQRSLVDAESDTLILYTATATDESSPDPNQSIRDELLILVTYIDTTSDFLTAAATKSDALTLTSKIAGDAFKISSIDYPGITGSSNSIQTQANIIKVTQVDSGILNSSVDVVPLGDTIFQEINVTPIIYFASIGQNNITAEGKYEACIINTTISVFVNADKTEDPTRSGLIPKINGVGISASVAISEGFVLTADSPNIVFSHSTPKDLQGDTNSSTTTTANISPSSVNKSLDFLTKVVVQDVDEHSRFFKANEYLCNNSQDYEQSQIRINDLDFLRDCSQVIKYQPRLDKLQSFTGKAYIEACTILSLLNKSNHGNFKLISQ